MLLFLMVMFLLCWWIDSSKTFGLSAMDWVAVLSP